MIVESADGFNSKDFSGYKPYRKPEKGYDWKDYCSLSSDSMKVEHCHMCDIRKTGCMSKSTPRYYCHKKVEKQTSLGDW